MSDLTTESLVDNGQQSVSVAAARNLATTTKTVPMTVGVTPRWLLSLLPWVGVEAGTYRVNRRRLVSPQARKFRFNVDGEVATFDPEGLRAIPMFREVPADLLAALAGRFSVESFEAGQRVHSTGDATDKLYVIASGKVEAHRTGVHGERLRVTLLGPGDYLGQDAVLGGAPAPCSIEALIPTRFVTLSRADFEAVLGDNPDVLAAILEGRSANANEYGEHEIEVQSGHEGETRLPVTYVDYEEDPIEYSLSVVQTILRIHTRITDVYNSPHDQLGQQVRLTLQAMKERQEWELVNHPEFGLLHQVAPAMRLRPRHGVPTPDDFDDLLSTVWKQPAFFLGHPRAIAAFGRECTRRGVPPPTVNMWGSPFLTWRGVPIVPCDKLAVDGRKRTDDSTGTTSIVLLRVGEAQQGVVGLHQPDLADAIEGVPSSSMRFMGINQKAVAAYLMTIYFSLAVLVDDALAVLEDVEVGKYHDYE